MAMVPRELTNFTAQAERRQTPGYSIVILAEHDRDDTAGETGGIGMQHIISVIEQHGLLVVFLNVLLAESGLPLPTFPTLIAAGALVTQSRFQVHEIVLSGVSGSLIADLAWYWERQTLWSPYSRIALQDVLVPGFLRSPDETAFAKVGPWSLLFAKFFPGLTTISVAMAGAHHNVVALLPPAQRNWSASVRECARAARLGVSKCDHRHAVRTCGILANSASWPSSPRLACIAGKMVAAAGVRSAASAWTASPSTSFAD